MTLAFLVSLAPAAQASSNWRLRVSPRSVTQGGSVNIKTTAGRQCNLTIGSWHYKLPRKGSTFTFPKNATPDVYPVTVKCLGRTKRSNITVTQATVQTPLTVANVCSENPGLGRHYSSVWNGIPLQYWLDGSGSRLTLMLAQYSPTNIAVVVGPDGQSVAYFAYCNWPRWLTIAQYEAAIGNTQASNLGYLLQTQTDQAIFQMNERWLTPSAGWQLCPSGPYDYCDYEPAP